MPLPWGGTWRYHTVPYHSTSSAVAVRLHYHCRAPCMTPHMTGAGGWILYSPSIPTLLTILHGTRG